jgi:hypothetical protein
VLELNDVLDGRFHGADYLVLKLHRWPFIPLSLLSHWPELARHDRLRGQGRRAAGRSRIS